jgi:heme oxygenase
MTLSERLKAATAESHRCLDRLPLLAGLLAPRLTLAEYEDVLVAFLGFFGPFEELLAKAASKHGHVGFFKHCRKAHHLVHDLRTLGRDPGTVPACSDLPVPRHEADVLGAIYVWEGSALGGRMIAKALARSIGRDATTGVGFFTGPGEAAVRDRWAETRAYLDTARVDPYEACEGAVRVFEKLTTWLAGHPPRGGA